MKRILFLSFLLLFSIGAYSQNYLHIWTGDSSFVVSTTELDSVTIRDASFYKDLVHYSDWELYGTGTYTYTLIQSGYSPDHEIHYRYNIFDNTIGQFNLKHVMFEGMDLIIDYNSETGACKVTPQYTGWNNDTYGKIYVSDIPNYPLEPGSTYEQYPCTFNSETGLFSLNLIYFVSEELGGITNGYFAYGIETFQLDIAGAASAQESTPKKVKQLKLNRSEDSTDDITTSNLQTVKPENKNAGDDEIKKYEDKPVTE